MSTDADRPYFPYIDGLRALSIIAVVLFHLQPGLLPGGFGGVDIFFVVSGFIVSGSLHGHKATSFFGLVTLFYSRRFRRIAPALLFMLVTTSLAVVLFIPEAYLNNNTRHTAFAAFFGISNFRLARGPDYFSPLAEFNPFTHTWSLGVEEQFYLIFPALIFLLTSSSRIARVSAFGLLALCLLSFVYGFIEPSTRWPLGFYSSFSRFWEIGSGVLLYAVLARYGLFEPQLKPRPEIRTATYAGSALIAAGLVAGAAQTYPVPGAILPVAGALLIITGLQGRAPVSIIGQLLSSPPAVSIGLISYSLYLWHWPVFVLFRWTAGFITPAQKLSALAVAVVMALVSYFLVERPLRRSPWLRPPLRAIAASIAAVVLCAIASDRMFGNGWRISASTVTTQRVDWYPGYEVRGRPNKGCRIEWGGGRSSLGALQFSRRVDCEPLEAKHKLFVIGDSHATSYITMFAEYARLTGTPVTLQQTPGCYFVHLVPSAKECEGIVNAVLDAIRKELKPGDVIFLPSLRVPRFRDQWSEHEFDVEATWREMALRFDAGYAETMAVFRKLNVPDVHFVFELPKPIFPTPLFRCSDWFNRDNPVCVGGIAKDRSMLERHRRPVLDFAERLKGEVAGFSTWDPFPVLCPGTTCSMMMNGKPLFFDGDHVSGFTNRLLLDDFMRKMASLRAPSR